mmetsp:Transcript_11644/g.26607  ORF Transcript_11644/g.26607 Transcript_11644/m.26607 type:complete len:226 (+) Transcript_11644:4232-4909(+)
MRWTEVRSVSCPATSERSESASDCIRFSFDADDWSCASTSLIFDAACWGRRRVQRTSSRRAHGTGRAGGLSRDDLGLLLPLLPQAGHLFPEPGRLDGGGILLDPTLQLGYLRGHGVVLPKQPFVLGLHPHDVVECHHVPRLGDEGKHSNGTFLRPCRPTLGAYPCRLSSCGRRCRQTTGSRSGSRSVPRTSSAPTGKATFVIPGVFEAPHRPPESHLPLIGAIRR